MVSGQTIGIAGAGSIGCFVGGMLAAGGRRVALLARPRVIAEIEANGLRPTSFEGFDQTITRDRFALSENPSVFEDAGVVLVTVKSADTAAMAEIIARHAPSDAVIVSLQNGVGNAAVLRQPPAGAARARRHGAVQRDRARQRAVSSRDLRRHRHRAGRGAHRRKALGAGPDDAADRQHRRRAMGQAARQSQQRAQCAVRPAAAPATRPAAIGGDCSPTRWRKAWRRCGAEGIKPVSPTPMPPALMPPLLRLPDAIFDRCWGATMKIDPEARSSMWEDLARPPHRDRLPAGGHHRYRRPPWPEGPAVAAYRGTDQGCRGREAKLAGPDTGADPRALAFDLTHFLDANRSPLRWKTL